MLFFHLALLSAVQGSSPESESLEPVLSRCCQLGSDWGRQRAFASCADFPAPVSSVPAAQLPLCISSAEICCRRDIRLLQCRRGTSAALADKKCDANAEEGGEAFRDCCEACEVGVLAGSLGQTCWFDRFAFGMPWDSAFHECCQHVANNASSPTSAPAVTTDNLCQALKGELCAHICVPTPGSYRCECHPGFELMSDGKSCQLHTQSDRCASNNPCDHNCVDTGLSVECSCRPGFVLESDRKTCSDIDECKHGTHTCINSQSCRNEPGGFSCVGASSSLEKISPLENELPSNEKRCPPGYVSNPKLDVCDDLDECATVENACLPPATCVNTVGSFRCQGSCPPGYDWDPFSRLCADMDECEDGSNDCDPDTEYCLNSEGSFECLERTQGRGSCPAGYKKDPVHRSGCSDVDECQEDIHTCHPESERCRNTAGAYACDPREPEQRCGVGMRFNPSTRTCTDVNECAEGSHTCSADEQCVNDAGGFHCERCPTGYHYNPLLGRCEDTDECLAGTHSCSPSESCINEEGTFQCSPACQPGFRAAPGAGAAGTGTLCVDIDECAEGIHSCPKATQRCSNTNGSFTCEDHPACPAGLLRNSAGDCVGATPAPAPTPTPGCLAGFYYSRVAARCLDVDECADPKLHICNNYTEQCINEPGGYRCMKREDATSTTTPAPSSSSTPASTSLLLLTTTSAPGRNTSLAVPGKCDAGYTYSFYSRKCVDVDECADNPCDSTQRCHNNPGSYSCECRVGYIRDPITKACVDINECQLGIAKCLASQRCDNTIGSYQCIRYSGCGTGYTLNAATGSCEESSR